MSRPKSLLELCCGIDRENALFEERDRTKKNNLMKHFFIILTCLVCSLTSAAQGWPTQYNGVMLQGFYWDSYDATQWKHLESQADELSRFFNLIWIPQSARATATQSMGYDDLYWFTNYNSSFGTEAELRSMITTFKGKGLGTLADVVINHRGNLTSWFDFPTETYNGVTYSMTAADVVADDDKGKAAAQAAAAGLQLSGNADTGEGWDGMRDLDHKSLNVQNTVKAYLKFLLNDLQYAGFRYDMTKGYAAQYTGLYNVDAQPQFSVGEYWDGNANTVQNWLEGTKVNGVIQSGTFDFPIRYTVRDALNNGTWNFAAGGIATNATYQRYAITFVENHDTEYRSATSPQDPIKKDTLAANAYLMAMPGTPCVFLKHWLSYKSDIKKMIAARKAAGIHSQSAWRQYAYSAGQYYAIRTDGDAATLLTVLGSGYTPSSLWKQVAKGHHYAMYLHRDLNIAWADLQDGTYEGAQTVTLTAVSGTTSDLVYTTDGSTPTATNGTKVTSGTTLNIPVGTTTLQVGLLVNGAVVGIAKREYVVTNFQPYTITIHVNTDQVAWSPVYFWSWGGDGTHTPTSKVWPGDAVTATKSVNGKNWYYKTFSINSSNDYVSLVLAKNSSTQTVDLAKITTDQYLEVSSTTDATGKHLVNDVSGVVTGIEDVENNLTIDAAKIVSVYSIDGRLIRRGVQQQNALSGLSKGVYVVDGKKYIVQ